MGLIISSVLAAAPAVDTTAKNCTGFFPGLYPPQTTQRSQSSFNLSYDDVPDILLNSTALVIQWKKRFYITLTDIQFMLLESLLEQPFAPIERSKLAHSIGVDEQEAYNQLMQLRLKFKNVDENFEWIQAHRSYGFWWGRSLPEASQIQFNIDTAGIQLSDQWNCALWNNEVIFFQPKEYKILRTLVSESPRVFSNDELFFAVWTNESTSEELSSSANFIRVHKNHIFEKFKNKDPGFNRIVSIRGQGTFWANESVEESYKFGELKFIPAKNIAYWQNHTIHLSSTETSILAQMLKGSKTMVDKMLLLPPNHSSIDHLNLIDGHIRNLNNKFKPFTANRRLIMGAPGARGFVIFNPELFEPALP